MAGRRNEVASSSKRTPFVYEPLKGPEFSIRLLEVLPSDGNSTSICIRLWETPLHEAGEYRCLSYTWGSPLSRMYEINVNGDIFHVRQNLYSFLRTASQQIPRMPIWIDAVSIDQENDTEKEVQVSRMAEVYNNATETYIWLGKSAVLNSAIGMLNTEPVNWKDRAVQAHTQELYLQPYWNRAWTSQEMIQSRRLTVLTAGARLDWDKFQHARDTPPSVMGTVDPHFSSFPAYFWTLWFNQRYTDATSAEGRHSIWLLLNRHKVAQCSDVRDRIYSVLSVVKRGTSFRVSYTDTPVELFWRAANHFGAWSQPDAVRLLREALGLTSEQLTQDIYARSVGKIHAPLQSRVSRASSLPLVLKTQCGHQNCYEFRNIATRSRQDLLLCTRVDVDEIGVSQFLHVLLSPSKEYGRQGLQLTLVVGRYVTVHEHCIILENLDTDVLQHQTEHGWLRVDSLRYVEQHIEKKHLLGSWRLQLLPNMALKLDDWATTTMKDECRPSVRKS
jgi:hypothetical protein